MPKWRYLPFAAFTAAFAVLAAIVFWGTWSTSVTFVSPDDGVAFPLTYGDTLQRWWNGFLTSGKILPTDIVWSGLLGGPHFCRELKYASAVYLAAFALSWFLRGKGLTSFASYGAGLCLAFSGYWLTLFSAGHAGWFIWMSYGVFAFGLIDRAIRRGELKWWLLLGVDVAWAGYQQQDLWLLFSAFTFVYLLYRIVPVVRTSSAPQRRTHARNLFISALVFALVSLPNWLDLVNVVKGREDQIARGENITANVASSKDNKSDDQAARWEFVTNWSMPFNETPEFFWPRLNGDTSCPFTISINAAKKGTKPYTGALGRPMNATRGNYRQHSLYVGWFTLILALVGVILSKERSTTCFFAIAALVFYLFSLGRYCEPVYRCIFALPAGDLIRCPVKWHHLTEFCLCVLAGYGIESILIRTAALRWQRWAVAVLTALLALNLYSLASNASLYCAPVDYSRAMVKRATSQLSVISRAEFTNPQIQAMVRAGYIVSVANWMGSPDAYLVQVLNPAKPTGARPCKPLPLAFGLVSLFTAAGAFVSTACGFRRYA